MFIFNLNLHLNLLIQSIYTKLIILTFQDEKMHFMKEQLKGWKRG